MIQGFKRTMVKHIWNVSASLVAVVLLAGGGVSQAAQAPEETVYSGPQVGEPLPPLPIRLVLDDDPSKTIDAAETTMMMPHRVVMVVHQLTRPSVAFVRALGNYAASRRLDGVAVSLVFLGEDATELAASVRRAQRALPQGCQIGLSPDGLEGPGAYGLNRNVTLTLIVASKGTVTYNAALIDPSIPVELPKVLRAICDVAGGEPPELDALLRSMGAPAMMRQRPADGTRGDAPVPNDQIPGFAKVEPLIRRFIRKENSDQEVDRLAVEIENALRDAPEAKQRVKEIAGRVHKIYGTERAQFHLRRWAEIAPDQPSEDNPSLN
jgi:hypothetical protein